MSGLLSVLSGAVQFIGGALMVLGIVNVGLTLKDGTGGGAGISGGVAMTVAGAMIVAVARMVSSS